MTRIDPSKIPDVGTYKKELDTSSSKFLEALEKYHQAPNGEAQAHLKKVMDQQMQLIQAAIQELNQRGMHKGGSLVVKDYMDYSDEQTDENYTCLHNDLETLRDLNKP